MLQNFLQQQLWLADWQFSFLYWNWGVPVKKTTLYLYSKYLYCKYLLNVLVTRHAPATRVTEVLYFLSSISYRTYTSYHIHTYIHALYHTFISYSFCQIQAYLSYFVVFLLFQLNVFRHKRSAPSARVSEALYYVFYSDFSMKHKCPILCIHDNMYFLSCFELGMLQVFNWVMTNGYWFMHCVEWPVLIIHFIWSLENLYWKHQLFLNWKVCSLKMHHPPRKVKIRTCFGNHVHGRRICIKVSWHPTSRGNANINHWQRKLKWLLLL